MNELLAAKLMARTTVTESGCWLWQGAKNNKGYGNTFWEGKYLLAHRAMYMAVHEDPLPSSVFICHSCDTPLCINPAHLVPGTQADNIHDMIRKGRHARDYGYKVRQSWTPERRAKRAQQKRAEAAQKHALSAQAAGVPTDYKRCPGCRAWLPKERFYKNRARHDGVRSCCISCSTYETRHSPVIANHS